jgi:hypothetical protein
MQATHSHKFETVGDARKFVFAGNAIITLQSLRTNSHFTYKVREADKRNENEAPAYFVNLLANGSADEGSFVYLGMVRNGAFSLTRASKAGIDAPSVKAFRFFLGQRELHPELVIRHEGRCGHCGRTLTEPESIDLGIGPVCREKLGM